MAEIDRMEWFFKDNISFILDEGMTRTEKFFKDNDITFILKDGCEMADIPEDSQVYRRLNSDHPDAFRARNDEFNFWYFLFESTAGDFEEFGYYERFCGYDGERWEQDFTFSCQCYWFENFLEKNYRKEMEKSCVSADQIIAYIEEKKD